MSNVRKQSLLALVVATMVVVFGGTLVGGAVAVWGVQAFHKSGPALTPTTVILERGSSLPRIAQTLQRADVIRDHRVFTWAAKLKGVAGQLKAGEYIIPPRASTAQVMDLVISGKVVNHKLTIPEGWTSAQVVSALIAHPVLKGDVEMPPEGSILPDTYTFTRGAQRQAVLDRMMEAQQTALANLWGTRQVGLPIKTPAEAVILASIVEKETGVAHERPMVASVFINRLNKGMRLESDPTIIYGISQGVPLGRGLRRSEIDRKTPYNTYQIDRLPPTPIANPGREALAAVLNPPQSDYLFFVADGSGGHAFSRNYKGHLANVAKWRMIERQARN